MEDRDSSFLSGYLCAVENLLSLHDKPTMAEDLLRQTSVNKQTLLRKHEESEYLNGEMEEVIERAFDR